MSKNNNNTKLSDIIKNYSPLLPLVRHRKHLLFFRYLLIFISIFLIQFLLLAFSNRKQIIKVVEISNPVEVFFDSDLSENNIQEIIKEIKTIPGISNAELVTSDTLRNTVLSNEKIFSEAEETGLSPFKNVGLITLLNSIGNRAKREKVITTLDKTEGISFVVYNQKKYNKIEFLIKMSNRVLTLLLVFVFVFFTLAALFSSRSALHFSRHEIDYINTTRILLPNLSIKKAFIAEGIILSLFAFISSAFILCLLWLISRSMTEYNLVFFALWALLLQIILISAFISAMNLFAFNRVKDSLN